MNAHTTEWTTPTSKDKQDYLDLEVPIREVSFMTGIASDLAWDLIGENLKREGDDVIIRMSHREYEQLLFALDRSRDMAVSLDKLYLAK